MLNRSVPHINPQEEKIETAKDKDKILERIDAIGTVFVFACVGSSDPVRVLCLYTTNTLDEVCSIYC